MGMNGPVPLHGISESDSRVKGGSNRFLQMFALSRVSVQYSNVLFWLTRDTLNNYGSVSGSGTGPGDPASRGPAMPDPETFPYEWLGVRQYISMPCFMSVIGKQIESCSEYLKKIHKINKIFNFHSLAAFLEMGDITLAMYVI